MSFPFTTVALNKLLSLKHKVSFKYRLHCLAIPWRDEYYFKACFVVVLTWWLFTEETFGANPRLLNIVELWVIGVSTYKNEVLIRNSSYNAVVTSHPQSAIGAEDIRVLMQKRKMAVLNQYWEFHITSDAAVHESFKTFISLLQSVRSNLCSAFKILLFNTICFLACAVKNCRKAPRGVVFRHRVCSAAWQKKSFYVFYGLAVKIAT